MLRIKNRVIKGDILFFILLFAIPLVLRFPTLFNDYYSTEEMTAFVYARDYISGNSSWLDPSGGGFFLKSLLYHVAFSISYNYGWAVIHFFTIISVFATSCFIYLSGANIKDKKTGVTASLFYAVMISSFNNYFMASGGEIFSAFFLTAAFYFFTLVQGYKIISFENFPFKGVFFIACSFFMGWCALHTSFHGRVFFIFAAVFFLFYLPYREMGLKSRYFRSIAVIAFAVFTVLFSGYLTGDILSRMVLRGTMSKIYHALTPEGDYNIVRLLYRFIRCQGLLAIWHILLWIPAFYYLWNFLKQKRKKGDIKEAALVLFFILTYIMIFTEGSSLSFDNFITSYPFLSILAALSLQNPVKSIIEKINRHKLKLILIPALFFMTWNVKDIVMKYKYPDAVYNENVIMLWARGILLGSDNNYLLPDRASMEAAVYIKKITRPGDRVFVWGDRPFLNYYSDRRMGGPVLRMARTAGKINDLYSSGIRKENLKARGIESDIISFLSSENVPVIADVSGNRASGFDISIKEAKHLYKYVRNNYYSDREIMGIRIYRRK